MIDSLLLWQYLLLLLFYYDNTTYCSYLLYSPTYTCLSSYYVRVHYLHLAVYVLHRSLSVSLPMQLDYVIKTTL